MAKYSNSSIDTFLAMTVSELAAWRSAINAEIAIENKQLEKIHKKHGNRK